MNLLIQHEYFCREVVPAACKVPYPDFDMGNVFNQESHMPLFEVAIIQKQTKKEAEDGVGGEKLLMKPTFVLAKDGQTAAIVAMMAEGAPKDVDMNRAEVLVRPFA